MYFIGSGSLLSKAVMRCITADLNVDGVSCPPQDSSIPVLRQHGISISETLNPNNDYISISKKCSDRIVFSINNSHIIKDELLNSELLFFNIHNGLVQEYRGIAEVCIFTALCRGETSYGVTLHRLLPNQKVDTGPVISQIMFDLKQDDTFSIVLKRSLEACQRIFELNVMDIISNKYQTEIVNIKGSALSYKDVVSIGTDTEAGRFKLASDLGYYTASFPKLKNLIGIINNTV